MLLFHCNSSCTAAAQYYGTLNVCLSCVFVRHVRTQCIASSRPVSVSDFTSSLCGFINRCRQAQNYTEIFAQPLCLKSHSTENYRDESCIFYTGPIAIPVCDPFVTWRKSFSCVTSARTYHALIDCNELIEYGFGVVSSGITLILGFVNIRQPFSG